MKQFAATIDWREHGPGNALVTVTSPVRRVWVVPSFVFDSVPVERWATTIVTALIYLDTVREAPHRGY